MEPTEDCGSRIIPDNARVAFAGRGATDDKCRLCSLWCLLCWYARVGFVGRGAINDSVVYVCRGATNVVMPLLVVVPLVFDMRVSPWLAVVM